VPLRAAPLFEAIENDTGALPVPDAPFVIAIHGAFDVALHAHVLADAVTVVDPLPPVESTF